MQWYWRIMALASLVFVASCGDSSSPQRDGGAEAQQPADWVLTGGRIFTVDDRNPWAEAVAIRGGEFVFVGDEAGAADTDFTAALVDVHPDGYSHQVQNGLIRASYRDGLDERKLLEPGRVYELTIDLWATS
jgi:predicted acyl esterase